MKIDEIKIVLAERLCDLRSEAGLTLPQLSDAIEKKTGVRISSQMLSRYENNDILKKENDIMSIKNAAAIAEYYGVSTDYLIGNINVKSRDMSVQAIAKYTDLTEEAILKLHSEIGDHYREDDVVSIPADFISNFITNTVLETLSFTAVDEQTINEMYKDVKRYVDFYKYSTAFKKVMKAQPLALFIGFEEDEEKKQKLFLNFVEEAKKLNAYINEDEKGKEVTIYDIFLCFYYKHTQKQRYYAISETFMDFIKEYTYDTEIL